MSTQEPYEACSICGHPLKQLILDRYRPAIAIWAAIQGPYCERCEGYYLERDEDEL